MTDNLPPLPKGNITYYITDSTMRRMECDAHSDSQMQAYARAAIEADRAARGAVPAGWRVLLAQSRENFRHNFGSQGLGTWVYEDVEELLAEAEAAPQPQPVQPSDEAAFLRSQIALALEEMSCANFNSAAERLRYVTDVAQAKPEQAAKQWQPIETAPKDMGPRLFLCNGICMPGFIDATGVLMAQSERPPHWREMRAKPTHWMPIPAAPQKPKD